MKKNCRNRQEWRSSPSSTLSASGSWDVRAHRLSTRAWRTTPSGHIPNESSPFAKVLTHLLLLVNMRQELEPGAQHAQPTAVLNRGPGQTSRKRLAAERGSRTHRHHELPRPWFVVFYTPLVSHGLLHPLANRIVFFSSLGEYLRPTLAPRSPSRLRLPD